MGRDIGGAWSSNSFGFFWIHTGNTTADVENSPIAKNITFILMKTLSGAGEIARN